MKADNDTSSQDISRSLQLKNMPELQNNHNEMQMNSSPECDVNNTSQLYSDSGYLTNFNQESRSLSMNSEDSSNDESLQNSKLSDSESSCNVYFCENAVFDEPKLEGPSLVCEDSITVGSYNTAHTKYLALQVNNMGDKNTCDGEIIEHGLDNTANIISDNKAIDCTKTEEVISFHTNSPSGHLLKKSDNVRNTASKITEIIKQDSSKAFDLHNIDELNRSYLNRAVSDQKLPNSPMNHRTTLNRLSSFAAPGSIEFDSKKVSYSELEQCMSISVRKFAPSESTQSLSQDCRINCTTPEKKIITSVNTNISPVLFSDEEEEEVTFPQNVIPFPIEPLLQVQKPIVIKEHVLKNDIRLLRQVQETLSGVPPPPSVTIIQITVTEMLSKIQSNKDMFLTAEIGGSDMKPTDCDQSDFNKQTIKSHNLSNSKEDIIHNVWPEIINYRYHGLHYNRSKVSEDLEIYCAKYASRYVGAETSSSCTVWSTTFSNSSTKKRNMKLRWAGLKSPGRRLSHLAKRRITFSSSNLQASCSTMPVMGSATLNTKQLMIDARKTMLIGKRNSPKKSPWKKSPRKSPQKKVRTPVSSSKKRVARRLLLGEDEPKAGSSKVSSTKRALFQSPDHGHSRSTTSSSADIKNFPQRTKSKRSLFISPKKQSPAKKTSPIGESKKRKRVDEDLHPSKFPRSLSFDVQHSRPSTSSSAGIPLVRRHSEMSMTSSSTKSELSDLHKRKLLWAVSEALRSQQVGTSHIKFRTFAPILCKIVKHLMPDLLSCGPRQPGSTSDRMLKIAYQHAFAVTRGKTFDEVMQQVKVVSNNLLNSKPPIGYVAPNAQKNEGKGSFAVSRSKIVLQDKIMNFEVSQISVVKSPDTKSNSHADENSKARIRRQIIFDDNETSSKSIGSSNR